MKELWVDASGKEAWEKRKKLVTTALENGASVVLVEPGEESKVLTLGRINAIAVDSNRIFIKDISSKGDEQEIVKEGKKREYVIFGA